MADGSGMRRAGLDGLPCGICLVSMDDEERVLYANRSFLLLMGFSSMEELFSQRGSSFKGLVAEGYVPLGQRCGAEERSGSFYFQLRTSSGSIPVKGAAGVYEDESLGKAWCLSCIRDRAGKVQGLEVMDRKAFYSAVTRLAREDVKKGIFGSRAPVYFNLTNFKVYNSRHGTEAGDDLIHFLAESLSTHFPHSFIAHLNGDTFAVLALHHDVAERIEAVSRDVRDYTGDPAVQLKAGVNIFDPDTVEVSESGIHLLYDRAKIAADWIKGDAGRIWAVYDKSMGQYLTDRAYVLGSFDRALKEGYIKVYYQPVIRTLNGKVCGTEALARWEDPVRGVIMPSVFVPVLEEAGLIHRLDCYVIEKVAKLYRFIMDNHRPFVPVSVNLSAVDFEVMDPFSFMEELIEKYQVPRSFFHMEITETALKRDGKRLALEIDRFRKAGYECWLDDFGSGYSTLNVLKSYHFDTLKLDMAFQRDMNEAGKKIISSVIFMAKELGVHTLAEGVETKEQADFLKSVGCEKIQGFYYSRPLPYEESYRSCLDQHMGVETAAEAALYDGVGLVNVVGDNPSGAFLFDGEEIEILFENDASRQEASSLHADYFMKGGRRIIAMDRTVKQQFRQLMEASWKHHRKETMMYLFRGQYVHCSMKVLVSQGKLYAGKLEYYAVSGREERKAVSYMDKLLRHLFTIYDGLYVLKKSGMVEVMESINGLAGNGETVPLEQFRKMADFIHEEDRKRFLAFMDRERLEKEAENPRASAVTGLFRLRLENGSYRWKEFNLAFMGPAEDGEILLGIKDTAVDEAEDGKELLSLYAVSYGLSAGGRSDWNLQESAFTALMENGSLCFFWKDRKRRFLGASRAFLEKFDLSLEDILGRTDEEIGWHVDGTHFEREEKKVLEEGHISRRVLGRCIIRGQVHRVRSTKFPLYLGNDIAGLMGYFFDLDEMAAHFRAERELDLIDQETGLLNYRGMLITAMTFQENYSAHGENYGAVLLSIPALDEVGRLYGGDTREKLLKRLTDTLTRFFFHREAIGSLGSGRFLVLMKVKSTSDVRQRMLELSNRVHEIHQAGGRKVTLFLQYALALGSEARTVDDLFRILSRRLSEAEKQKYGESLYRGDRIAFDRRVFDNSSDQVVISDPDDYSLLYINKAGLRDLGYPDNYDYAGKKCYEVILGGDRPCDGCPLALLRRDRFYTQTFHNRFTGHDYLTQHTLISWYGKNCQFEIATNLGGYAERDFKKNYMVFREMAVNDAIEAGLSADDTHEGMMNMLARIGKILEAEKACIFEVQEDGSFKNTYEWCRKGAAPEQEKYQHVPADMVRPIYDRFGADQVAIIDDIEAVAKSYGFAASDYRKGLKRLISGHLLIGGQSLGYTEIVNPSEKAMKEASPLLATLTRFIAIMIRNRDTMDKLKAMGHVDQLTGLMNRRSFMEYIHALPAGRKTAFLFGDMNGLKQINDGKGHEAGDRALITLSSLMADLVGRDHAFRMGGDEFIMVLEGATAEKVQQVKEELKSKLALHGLSIALGCALRTAPVTDIDSLISEVDKKMYEDKKNPRK